MILIKITVDDYFDVLMQVLLREYTMMDVIEDIWVGGQEDRAIFEAMTDWQKDAVANLETPACQVYLNGVYGREWDYGLSNATD